MPAYDRPNFADISTAVNSVDPVSQEQVTALHNALFAVLGKASAGMIEPNVFGKSTYDRGFAEGLQTVRALIEEHLDLGPSRATSTELEAARARLLAWAEPDVRRSAAGTRMANDVLLLLGRLGELTEVETDGS